jgi:PIN domain nuclease of toxin-antitoxin system
VSVQVLADTHALIWYLFDEGRLSSEGRAALDGAISAGFPILVSAISIIEVIYLEERHRIGAGATERIRQACEAEDPSIEIVPIDARVAHSIQLVPRADVPDMPDRIIAATAVSLGVPLVTRDGKIRASSVQTIRA